MLTADRLNTPPEQCLVIEDTPHGVEAGKDAGMYVVALLTSYTKSQLQHADMIINHYSQLIWEDDKILIQH